MSRWRALLWVLCSLLCGMALPAAHAAPEAAPAPPSPLSFSERLNQPITAEFQEVDFSAATSFLAEQAGVNILLSPNAAKQGKPITVHLVGMPLRRALEHLLKGQGLLFRLDEQAIWVATREEMEAEPLQTRVYVLHEGPGLFAQFEPPADTRDSVALQANSLRALVTIKDILTDVIPVIGDSTFMLDQRSGSLVVTHVPYYLEQVEALLAQLDVAAPQILIEARFLELTVTDTNEWGFDADLTGDAALTKRGAADGTRGAGLALENTGTLLRGTQTDFTSFTNQTDGNGLNLTLQGILSGTQYQAVLHALMTNERTKTLSAPRVTTLNNQTATIKVVTEFVYATRYEASVVREDLNSDGDFSDTVSDVKETRFVNVPQDFVTKDLGILLHVTPTVGSDLRTITLALKPEVSERKTTDEFGGEVELPRFTTRNLETSIVIQNGETVMLGGLMQDTTTKTRTQVPLLGALPGIGKLFRKESDAVERSNLVIFVSAQIIDPSGDRLAFEKPPQRP
jgi:general secretion pathway protein D